MENCKGTVINNNNYYCCCHCEKKNNNDNDNVTAEVGQVGAIVYAHTLLPGHVKVDGQLLEREKYPELFTYAKENNLILAETDWENDMQGMFAEGDGVNTFRVPDLRGQFLRGLDETRGVDIERVLGSQQEDAIRNITGKVGAFAHYSTTEVEGVLGAEQYSGLYTNIGASYSGNGVFKTTIDASRVVPTAEENRPKNIALIPQIKY